MKFAPEHYTFELAIGHLLELAGVTTVGTPSELARVDYVFLDKSGSRIAIEARGGDFRGDSNHLTQLAKAIEPIAGRINKLILVTSFKPDEKRVRTFDKAFEGMPNVEWLSFLELARFLGVDVGSLDPAGSEKELRESRHRTEGAARKTFTQRSRSIDQSDLARQMSRAAIHKLEESATSPETFLRIGERVPVIIVQSDIQNFSLIVKAVKPDDLNNAMAKYYRLARALAWSYGGVLDKFIGDSVLTIFNYPWSDEDAPVKAARFASDLIQIGKPIFGGLSNLINEAIITGTRVGISMGEVSVLNIGLRGLELSFVGDALNLAARLEHESDVDSFLVDNLTKGAISRNNSSFFQQLGMVRKELSRERVKGQLTSIQAWQIPSSVVPQISDLERDLTVGL